MVAGLILLQFHASTLTRQPQTVVVVGYQRVQHALPNGAPDPNAPDNFYVRVTAHWYLFGDSDSVKADASGLRLVHVPGQKVEEFESYRETATARGWLAQRFKEVRAPISSGDARPRKVAWGTFEATDQTIHQGNHFIVYRCKLVVEEVETHSDWGGPVTRIHARDSWSTVARGLHEHTFFDPATERVAWYESKPEVRVDPPVYGYVPMMPR
jgi:hypothetical protein